MDKDTKLIDLANEPYFEDIFDFVFLPNADGWQEYVLQMNIEQASKAWYFDALNVYQELVRLNKEGYIKKIYLNNDNKDPRAMYFKNDKSDKIAILTPGGAYANVCSFIEGVPVAIELYKRGFNVFILHYRVGVKLPAPLDDVASLYRYIMKNYPELNINETLLLGCSAGGHLAGMYGTKEVGYKSYNLPKPKYICLVYPVVSMNDEYTHDFSRLIALGENPSQELKDKYSLEKQIDSDYPMTYLWQGDEDAEVKVENSKILNEALNKAKVPHLYHLIAHGKHAVGLGINTPAEPWFKEMLNYFKL